MFQIAYLKWEVLQFCFPTKGLIEEDQSTSWCFSCVTQMEDSNGKVGVALSKDLMAVVGDALKTNITTLGPLVLPVSEQLLFFATLVGRKLLKM